MFKDFENKLIRKLDKKLAANAAVMKQELVGISDKMKVDSRQRIEISERQLKLYCDDAIKRVGEPIQDAVGKATKGKAQIAFLDSK